MFSQFLKDSLKALLPVVFIFSFLFVSGHLSSDYYFHMSYQGDGTYPPFLSWLLWFSGEQRSMVLFTLNLLFTTLLPYCLICKITEKTEAGWVYLYSGIPLVLFVIWLVPQEIIHCLMLFSILNPFYGLIIFGILGFTINQFWWAGYALVLIYHAYKIWREG